MSFVALLACLAAALSAAMAVAWAIARYPGRSGWADAIWSFAIGAAGVAAALFPITGPPGARQWLVAAMVAVWSLRLGAHIALRTAKGGDDPRYAELRREWGRRYVARLFFFLQIQAAAAWLLTVSILLAARNPVPALAWSDASGVFILAVAVIGEGVADRQLARFRSNPANKGKVCDVGLWALSRHPNYFFEWFGWVAYAVIAIGPAGHWRWGWLTPGGPIFMYWLLVRISGIPPLEAHMRRSRGAAFDAYRKRVGAFWPLPPRHSGEASA